MLVKRPTASEGAYGVSSFLRVLSIAPPLDAKVLAVKVFLCVRFKGEWIFSILEWRSMPLDWKSSSLSQLSL